MDKMKTAVILKGLTELNILLRGGYDDATLKVVTLLWSEQFDSYSPEEIDHVMSLCRNSCERFPSPALAKKLYQATPYRNPDPQLELLPGGKPDKEYLELMRLRSEKAKELRSKGVNQFKAMGMALKAFPSKKGEDCGESQ